MSQRTYEIQLALLFTLVGMLIVVFIDSVYGQTTTSTSTNTQPLPPTTPTIATNPSPGGTPTVATQEPIATTEDLASQFNTLLGTTGGTVAGGIGALWAIIRKKNQKIDNALRGSDFDHRDLMEIQNTFYQYSKENPDKTPGQILLMKAYPNDKLSDITLAQAWSDQYKEYEEWFNERYVMNKT